MEIYDKEINFIGEIDNFESCIITRKYLGIETLETVISANSNMIETLKKYNIIYAGERKVFEILHSSDETVDKNMLKITAFGFGKTLCKRITIPPQEEAEDVMTGSRDAIVKHFIINNIIGPLDAKRKITYIENASVHGVDSITERTRLKNLNDEVVRILSSDDSGYFFDLNKTSKKIVFDTYQGKDLTAYNSSGNPPAIFSLEYDNIKEQYYIDSMVDAKTNIYVGGQGEGNVRTIVEVGENEGVERFESFVDARDTNDLIELINRGLSEKNLGVISFEARVNSNSNLIYRKDFDLGDIVTVQYKKLGITIDTRIVEVIENYSSDGTFELDVVFGNTYPSFLSDIKSQSKRINQLSTI